jgi:hypothetical protein
MTCNAAFSRVGSSSDRVFLSDEVTRTGKRFALPCKAQPAEQFHGGGMLAKNRRLIKCGDQGRRDCSARYYKKADLQQKEEQLLATDRLRWSATC